ncbi:uncharacterized protein BYT42DRAFT_211614 [Radiomyces spectabilis]|uniref:uncharacterized protein n=1 Tax=Radiomyces spectabilis TaxID=64574 RepID=UPI00221E5610|nr:uncharacterized protein BYT42DRAFT_211614 [Radiomyces spectabilis]KAI8364349.1 hypothetical protein BYT42DRAFT_211614 [Radiomyces spectabilis]
MDSDEEFYDAKEVFSPWGSTGVEGDPSTPSQNHNAMNDSEISDRPENVSTLSRDNSRRSAKDVKRQSMDPLSAHISYRMSQSYATRVTSPLPPTQEEENELPDDPVPDGNALESQHPTPTADEASTHRSTK